MRKKFINVIVKEIRKLREYEKAREWDLYAHQLNTVGSKATLAVEIDLITFNQWKRIIDLIYTE